MIEDLLKFLKIKTERNNEGKNFELIEKTLLSKLYTESNFFNFISFYGLFSIMKLYEVWNWTKIDSDINFFMIALLLIYKILK